MSNALSRAYRFYRQHALTPRPAPTNSATMALSLARRDVANGVERFPREKVYPSVCWQSEPVAHDPIGTFYRPFPAKASRLAYVENPASAGLRLVSRVVADCGGRNGIWDKREDSGWFTDPHGDVFRDGSGLCYGVVYQLPGKAGKARFVAGYQFGGTHGGPTLDLSRVYEEETSYYSPARNGFGGYWSYMDSPLDMDAAQDAARTADSMAKGAAEEEREYQTAWQAGQRYSDLQQENADSRETVKALLADRRKARLAGLTSYHAICATIRKAVSNALGDIADNREKMAKLADGEGDNLSFWSGDKRLQAAFCEGGNLETFPA